MGTGRGVLGGGRVREVVARGKQSEGDDSFRPCSMKAVRGVYGRTRSWLDGMSGPRSIRTRLGGGPGGTLASSVLSSR